MLLSHPSRQRKPFRVEEYAEQARHNPLFQPVQVGAFPLEHSIVYAPLTR